MADASGTLLNPTAAPPDMTAQYNTPLSESEQPKFDEWLAQQSTKRGYDMRLDMQNYDLQGFWQKNGGFDERGHATDEFKKPNHPTFSSDSKYDGEEGLLGGKWQKKDGKWTFQAGSANLAMFGAKGLQSYFSRVEPDSTLILPQQ